MACEKVCKPKHRTCKWSQTLQESKPSNERLTTSASHNKASASIHLPCCKSDRALLRNSGTGERAVCALTCWYYPCCYSKVSESCLRISLSEKDQTTHNDHQWLPTTNHRQHSEYCHEEKGCRWWHLRPSLAQENNQNQDYEQGNTFVGGFDIDARQIKYE